MNIFSSIKNLINYAIAKDLISSSDEVFFVNAIMDVLGLDNYVEPDKTSSDIRLENILKEITGYAVSQGIIEDTVTSRDLFDTRIMGIFTPRPSSVRERFAKLYIKSQKEATDYFYKLSCDTNYIRTDRIKKDKKWVFGSPYGNLDITINLSKPEKDPKEIAKAKFAPVSSYPKCPLCKENEGYSGNINKAARQNHRIIPLSLNGTDWFLQYSPYVYYNEHCIVLDAHHTPMKISRDTFIALLDFIKTFPHYFVGSNADLPIVGGSILSHNHFQGGCYEFAMAKAPIEIDISFKGYEDIKAGIVKWPMSVIRLSSSSVETLADLAEKIFTSWQTYTDESSFIYSCTNGELHNTITPIARMREGKFELDLVLRNNITTREHPLGVYHPHSELHNIKKENIGLIEVMGLAVLPSRLDAELSIISDALVKGDDISQIESVNKHSSWVNSFIHNYDSITSDNVDTIVQNEVGKVFLKVLEHSGVFKDTENGRQAFLKFINQL